MPVSIPPAEALREFLGATTRHTRRVEIYEEDGVTRWAKDTASRLKGGSVTVEYGRDERRGLDLTLANDDGVLVNAPGEFWYDKILKVFRGVRINAPQRIPRVYVLSDKTGEGQLASSFRDALVSIGYGEVRVNTITSDYSEIEDFDIIVGLGNANAAQIELLKQAYQNGKSVFVQDADAADFVAAVYPTAVGVAEVETGRLIAPPSTSPHPLGNGWTSFYANLGYVKNLVPNPSFTTSESGWSTGSIGTLAVTSSRITTGGADNGPFRRVRYEGKPGAASPYTISGYMPVQPNRPFTAVMTMRSKGIPSSRVRLWWYSAEGVSAGTSAVSAITPLDENWRRIAVTATPPAGATLARVATQNYAADFIGTQTNTVANPHITGLASSYTTARGTSTIVDGKIRTVVDGSGSAYIYAWGNYGIGAYHPTVPGNRVSARVKVTNYSALPQFVRLSVVTYTSASVNRGVIGVSNITTISPGETIVLETSGDVVASDVDRYLPVLYLFNDPIGSSPSAGRSIESSEWAAFNTLPDDAPPSPIPFFGGTTLGATWTGAENSSASTMVPFLDLDEIMFHEGDFVVDYFDGDTTDTADMEYAWTGTANLSASTAQWKNWKSWTPVGSNWKAIAPSGTDSSRALVSAFEEPVRGGRAAVISAMVNYQQYDQEGFVALTKSAVTWLNNVAPLVEWEVQVGEFMIDRISEPSFPHEVRITGRDYTKKCMLSKFAFATQFDEGLTLESLIGAIAGSAGITKRSLPATGVVVGRTFHFERGVSRWDAMKEVATAYDHEIFFDATGYLVIRPYRDPATSSPTIYVETGRQGQIGSYEKSTTDTRLFNHIIVTGESSDPNVVPVYAERKNEAADSPTSVQQLGDRLFEYTSAFITTQQQADDLADSLLAVNSLEEFELTFESLMLPWLEVGDIIGWIDPNPAPDDPTTFLLSSLTIPLSLGPMSGAAKRVTRA